MATIMTIPWLLATAGGALLLGAALAYALFQSGHASRTEIEAGEQGARRLYHKAANRPAAFVRPAGREAMRNPPAQWDDVDETSDESFPASDPPARY